MGDASESSGRLGHESVIELTGKIMVVAIIILLFIVVFVFCLHLYAKYVWYRRQDGAEDGTPRRRWRRRSRLEFAAGHQERAVRQGLEPSVLSTIPVVLFDPKEFKDGLECAVCLSELSEGEKARLLPKCSHGFHVECIDMWFQSHATCPLCRNPVTNPDGAETPPVGEDILHAPAEEGLAVEAPSFPTNVLFWGDETQVSTFGPCVEAAPHGSGAGESSSSSSSSSSAAAAAAAAINRPNGGLVIDIPRQGNDEEDQKSPIPTRLRALKRLLSGNRRVNPSSPRDLDLEQGTRGQN